ncbi:MAG: hypothetical protein QNJ87_12085, partial [Gammaproteobacteria bacterium]|nr:hypothetical protein [Gammaproteobacteria bacterium]
FIFGLWIGTGKPGGHLLRRTGDGSAQPDTESVPAVSRASGRVRSFWSRRAWPLAQRFNRVVRRLGSVVFAAGVGLLPKRARSWWCVRCVGTERDPVSLCRTLRRFACDELRMNPNAPLPAIADRIAEERPRADTAPLRNLFNELEAAAYGGQRIDLVKWKRTFGRRFRRVLSSKTRDESEDGNAGLPKLNP